MKKYMCIASFSAAILFAAVGMAIPPQGVIDGSVLILAAQLFVLCATFLAIKDLSLPKKGKTVGASIQTTGWKPVPHSAMICIGTGFQPVVGMGS